jgi:hypothetical protein
MVVKPTERFQKHEKGQRRVRDPITSDEIIVKDVDPKGISMISRAYIDFDSHMPSTQGTNVLYHAFPPPSPPSLAAMLGKLRMLQYASAGCLLIVWLTMAFGAGIKNLIWRSTVCGILGFALMTGISLVERGVEKEVERVRQDMGRARGEAFSPPIPESVEWLNGLIKLIWGVIDPYEYLG